MRGEVTNPDSRKPKIIKLLYLLRIKRIDAFHNASMGTDLSNGATFFQPPILPHGLNGIIISHYAIVGKNCTIFQRVTIAERENKAAIIGNNCVIGTGTVILGGLKIGDNVIIGANSVVTKDIPDNSTAVGAPARLIRNDILASVKTKHSSTDNGLTV